MGRDTGKEKKPRQGKSLPISNASVNPSLEEKVSAFLIAKKGEKSLGVFAATIGIHKATLLRYLNCNQSMSLGTLEKIAKALGVKPTALLK